MTSRIIPAVSIAELAPLLEQIRERVPRVGEVEKEQAAAAAKEWENWCRLYETGGFAATEQMRWEHLQAGQLPKISALEVPFVTIDPSGSRDLDQAVALERIDSEGFATLTRAWPKSAFAAARRLNPAPQTPAYLVHYAIATPGAFFAPGSAIDRGVWERGLTTYLPGENIALHPLELSHGAASLLPGQLRPALWWRLVLDQGGHLLAVYPQRALVRSRMQLSYRHMQKLVDGQVPVEGDIPQTLPQLLAEVGRALLAAQSERGGVSARIPEATIEAGPQGLRLRYRGALDVEEWNAQISLLTGMAAAALMRQQGRGILRIVPAPPVAALERLRRVAGALELDWPSDLSFAEFQRGLDAADPAVTAFLAESTSLYRGSGYALIDAATEPSPHAAIAAEYAHVTAPLRRLVDRYASELVLQSGAGEEEKLQELAATMARAAQRTAVIEKEVVHAIQNLVLEPLVGSDFVGVVVDRDREDRKRGKIMLRRPAMMGRIRSQQELPLGRRVHAQLHDLDQGRAQFVLISIEN